MLNSYLPRYRRRVFSQRHTITIILYYRACYSVCPPIPFAQGSRRAVQASIYLPSVMEMLWLGSGPAPDLPYSFRPSSYLSCAEAKGIYYLGRQVDSQKEGFRYCTYKLVSRKTNFFILLSTDKTQKTFFILSLSEFFLGQR